MNLKHLETFYWAAKLGSFTAAAERLHATQSTVSMRIQELERFFGVQLFDRSQRTARLTAKGRELIGHAERMIRLKGEIEERIAAPDSLSGLVRLGVAEVVSLTWLPDFVKTLHQRYPAILLELDEALTVDLVDKLRGGRLDIVFAPGEPKGLNLMTHRLGTVEFAWMASPELELPAEPIRPPELARFPIISLSRESYHYASIESWFQAAKTACKRIDTCKSMGVVAALAAAGLGIGFLPARCFARDLAERRLRILETRPKMAPVQFSAMVSADSLEPITRTLAELACEISDFNQG